MKFYHPEDDYPGKTKGGITARNPDRPRTDKFFFVMRNGATVDSVLDRNVIK